MPLSKFTQEEITAAKQTRDEVIRCDRYELKSVYMAGEIVMWDELQQGGVYTKSEVIEILRQVMFSGTPELYDNGGLHGNHNLSKNHTTERAREQFEKYISGSQHEAEKANELVEALEKLQRLTEGWEAGLGKVVNDIAKTAITNYKK